MLILRILSFPLSLLHKWNIADVAELACYLISYLFVCLGFFLG